MARAWPEISRNSVDGSGTADNQKSGGKERATSRGKGQEKEGEIKEGRPARRGEWTVAIGDDKVGNAPRTTGQQWALSEGWRKGRRGKGKEEGRLGNIGAMACGGLRQHLVRTGEGCLVGWEEK